MKRPANRSERNINGLLTDKENEIFAHQLSGLSNSQISAQTGVALSTAKWHLKNIYAKLNVANRTEAILCVHPRPSQNWPSPSRYGGLFTPPPPTGGGGRPALPPTLPSAAACGQSAHLQHHKNKRGEIAMAVWVTWPALTKLGTLGIFAGLLTLSMEREALLKNNLFDVDDYPRANKDITCDERSKTVRTEDGTCNILSNPAEGSVNRRFGRNVDPSITYGETAAGTLLTPNPREVSNVLLARDTFKPATSLNFIAGSWIQFMVHDWVSHGVNSVGDEIQVPLPAGDVLGSGSLSIQRTQADLARSPADAGKPPTYRNVNTHWWDGSQLYGSSKESSDKIRSFVDGRLKVNADNSLPTELISGKPITGVNDNWWLGLSMLHQLFTLEHNAIAGKLKQTYPAQTDQWIYDHARLANAALMAKIHTIEWTPAIIANPVTERAMHANWYGLLGDGGPRDKYQEEIRQVRADLEKSDSFIARILGIDPNAADGTGSSAISHALAGIVGSAAPNNHGTPYTLTEEFVAVYRMHPLLRDKVDVYDIGANVAARSIPFENTRDRDAPSIINT